MYPVPPHYHLLSVFRGRALKRFNCLSESNQVYLRLKRREAVFMNLALNALHGVSGQAPTGCFAFVSIVYCRTSRALRTCHDVPQATYEPTSDAFDSAERALSFGADVRVAHDAAKAFSEAKDELLSYDQLCSSGQCSEY